MNFEQDYFELFQLTRAFEVSLNELKGTYLDMQKAVHPDRFASASPAEQRQAAQWTSHINTAFETLKHPLSRAVYLLKLEGVELEHNPRLPGEFLMSQIELREALDDVGEDLDALDSFRDGVKQQMNDLYLACAADYPQNLKDAELGAYKLQFINRLDQAAEQKEAGLLDC